MQWVPAIYNIRQLEARHLPILKEIEKLIKLDIPFKYGIISKEDYDAKLQYELFNSYYKYVNFFHITAEYLHTMSNLTDYAHNLKDSITLEEIIYSVGREVELGNPFWAHMRFDYKIRNYRIVDYTDHAINMGSVIRIDSKKKLRNRSNTHTKKQAPVRDMKAPVRDIIFLLMYEDTYANYTFIYKEEKEGRIYFKKNVFKT